MSLVDGDGLTWGWGYPQGETLPLPETAGSKEAIVRSDLTCTSFRVRRRARIIFAHGLTARRQADGRRLSFEPAEAAVQVEAATVQPAVGDLPLSRQMMIELSPV